MLFLVVIHADHAVRCPCGTIVDLLFPTLTNGERGLQRSLHDRAVVAELVDAQR
jgi:hypothetical protein